MEGGRLPSLRGMTQIRFSEWGVRKLKRTISRRYNAVDSKMISIIITQLYNTLMTYILDLLLEDQHNHFATKTARPRQFVTCKLTSQMCHIEIHWCIFEINMQTTQSNVKSLWINQLTLTIPLLLLHPPPHTHTYTHKYIIPSMHTTSTFIQILWDNL